MDVGTADFITVTNAQMVRIWCKIHGFWKDYTLLDWFSFNGGVYKKGKVYLTECPLMYL